MPILLDYGNEEAMRQLAKDAPIDSILHWQCSGISTFAKVLRKESCGCLLLRTCLEDGTKYPYYNVQDDVWDLGCNGACQH